MQATFMQWAGEWLGLGGDTLAQPVFRVIALAGLLMTLLQLLLRLLGFDHHDAGFDFSADGHGDGHFLSWTTLSGFALGFGSVGSLLLRAGVGVPGASLGGAAAGLGVGAIFYFIMRALSAMKEDNTFQIQSSVGQIGTAYIRIPAKQTGGQVQVVAQSRLVTLAALCDEEIASGEKVRIIEALGPDTVRVERLA